METVDLLVDCFYQYEERAEKERLDKEREDFADMLAAGGKVERKTSNG